MSNTRFESRTAFTVVELLVVIGIIAMLMALLLPAVQQARESGAGMVANNIRNVGTALLGSTNAVKRFPASGYYAADVNGNVFASRSWVVPLLALLERSDIDRQWNHDAPIYAQPNLALAQVHLDVLCCPDDLSVVGKGDLSYAVNGGVGFTANAGSIDDCPVVPGGGEIDLNGNGITCPPLGSTSDGAPSDRSLLTMLGLFFVESGGATGTTRHHSPDSVYDGLSQTFLLAENVRAGYDPATANSGWASPDPHYSSVYFSSAVCQSLKCSAGNVDWGLANSGSQQINAGLTGAEGEGPWPSSFHPGGANFVFADGHLRFVSQDIDGAVYAALFSPQGEKLDAAKLTQLWQRPVDDASIQ